jgi:hypothetical protein
MKATNEIDSDSASVYCFYCGSTNKSELVLCNWCRSVYYCSKHHGFHRNRSKCCPFIISVTSDGKKKVLASRSIRTGENIFTEKPAIVAPAPNSTPVCTSCLGKLQDPEKDRCQNCSLPMCSPQCQKSVIHQPGTKKVVFSKLQTCKL